MIVKKNDHILMKTVIIAIWEGKRVKIVMPRKRKKREIWKGREGCWWWWWWWASVIWENKEEKEIKSVQVTANVKLLMESGMLCTIDREIFHSFMKNTWIGDSSTLHHIMNDNMGSLKSPKFMSQFKEAWAVCLPSEKGKLCINVWQVYGTEWVHTQWLIKFCPKADANPFP